MAAHPFSPTLEELPAEVLARIFSLLQYRELSQVEAACRRCRSVVVTHELWLAQCMAVLPAVADAAACIDTSAIPQHRPAAAAAAATAAAAAAAGAAGTSAAASRPSRSPSPLPGLPSSQAVRRSAFFKRLRRSLNAPVARESLVAAALGASSTDHPQETVANVLDPIARSRQLTCYWSSRGSMDEDSNEALLFQLAHPLCLVTEVQMRPFRAFFQWGAPIYAPKAVRFRLGGLACFAPDGTRLSPLQLAEPAWQDLQAFGRQQQVAAPAGPGGEGGAAQQAAQAQQQQAGGIVRQGQQQFEWVWESAIYPVVSHDGLQEFDIPPTLCVGGCLRVELLGKRQRQAADDAYYTCVCYVRAVGAPIYNFFMRQLPAPDGAAGGQQQQQQEGQQEQRQQQQAASGSGAAGGAAAGSGADGNAAAEAPGGAWQLVYCESDPLLAAGGLVAVSEGGRLLRHGLVQGPEGQMEVAEGVDASDTDDDETLDIADEMEGGDLDALAAVDFAGLPPQAFPWAGPPVEGPPGAGEGGGEGAEGDGSGSSGDSESESSEESSSSDGSEGGISSSSSGGSEGEAMDEDEEDEWFPGGDAGSHPIMCHGSREGSPAVVAPIAPPRSPPHGAPDAASATRPPHLQPPLVSALPVQQPGTPAAAWAAGPKEPPGAPKRHGPLPPPPNVPPEVEQVLRPNAATVLKRAHQMLSDAASEGRRYA